MQSTLHAAIIMDGNGRWARARGWPRAAGHRAGVAAVRRVVAAAPRCGIGVLSLYAFSADNWRRPPGEVAALLGLLREFLVAETAALAAAGVRCTVIGWRQRLPQPLLDAIAACETATAAGGRLWLRLAIDYSARAAIAAAAAAGPSGLARRIEGEAGPVDLLIRTGGEQRLSDFLLWESAYAELIFTRTAWPRFGAPQLRRALARFHRRQRRFGALGPASEAWRRHANCASTSKRGQ